MKTILITTFAIAVMVFAFNANPAMAKSKKCPEGQVSTYGGDCIAKRRPTPTPEQIRREQERYMDDWRKCMAGAVLGQEKAEDCMRFGQMDELNDPDQPNNERAVADSGEEGSTSAASADEQ